MVSLDHNELMEPSGVEAWNILGEPVHYHGDWRPISFYVAILSWHKTEDFIFKLADIESRPQRVNPDWKKTKQERDI